MQIIVMCKMKEPTWSKIVKTWQTLSCEMYEIESAETNLMLKFGINHRCKADVVLEFRYLPISKTIIWSDFSSEYHELWEEYHELWEEALSKKELEEYLDD